MTGTDQPTSSGPLGGTDETTAHRLETAGVATGIAEQIRRWSNALPDRRRYARVVHEVPAAALLVDVRDRTVVHANPAALLIADLPLPVAVSDWVTAAGLAPPGATAFAPGSGPLGATLSGRSVPGQAVVVRRDGDRRPMWVTGFPLPLEGRDLALLLFLDLETTLPEAQIRDRAVVAAGLSFTITDATAPDNPLIYVNPAFERTTGYTAAESIGSNCRFLQCEDTDPAAVKAVREAIASQEHSVITLLNQRKDGTRFWNELSISPVLDEHGTVSHFVGIQADVTLRVAVEAEKERHLAAEQEARAAAERAQRRLAVLAEATLTLSASLDVAESLRRLTRLVVPFLSDWCTVHLLDHEENVQQSAGAHADAEKQVLVDRLAELQPVGLSETSATLAVLRGGPPVLVERVTRQLLEDHTTDPKLAEVYDQLGSSSAVVVPLRVRQTVLGSLTLMNGPERRPLDEDDLMMAAELARRAAITIDNARLYQREHDVAEALQRSLLPELPAIPGLDVGWIYLPSSTTAQVGGDWYDLFALPDGTVAVAVGDVMGHDLTAAAAMGQLRSVLRSYAWQGHRPARVLDQLDQLVQGLGMAQLATAVYGRLTLPVGGTLGELVLASAGHLPPVLREPDGATRLLDDVQSVLVGAAQGMERDEASVEIRPGCTLVLYTDGLVERRGVDPDAGLETLRSAVARADISRGAQHVVDQLVTDLQGSGRQDDVAVLVVTVAG